MHSVVAQGGNKIDAFGDPDKSLAGTMQGSIAKMEFNSSFGGKGKANVFIKGKSLHWQITQDDGIHYLPQKAKLKRVRNDKWGSKLSCS